MFRFSRMWMHVPVLGAVVVLVLTSAAATSAVINVACVGDSVTQGYLATLPASWDGLPDAAARDARSRLQSNELWGWRPHNAQEGRQPVLAHRAA